MQSAAEALRAKFDTSSETIKANSHDASIFEVTPQAVVRPKTIAELAHIVALVNTAREVGQHFTLTARVGGTCMSGGSLTEGIIVDLASHLHHISPIDTRNRTIWVEGGTMHIDVEKATHPHDLLFAPYTSSRDICGIGGMLGNNASGEKSVKYGPTSANVGRIKVLLSDGEIYEFGPLTHAQVEDKKELPGFEGRIYREMTTMLDENWHLIDHNHPRTVKNAAGYPLWQLWDAQRQHLNLARLFIGAQGTLGIITEAELRLVPMPKSSRMILVPIENLSELAPVVQTMMKHHPDACETFDYHTYDLAKVHFPEDAERAKVAAGKHMVVFAIYTGDTQAQADDFAKVAQTAVEQVSKQAVAWIEDAATIESILLIRRKSFKMLLDHPDKNTRAMAFLEDTIVPLEHYGEFLAALESILADYDMTYTYAGHIGAGSIRLIPLVNMEQPDSAEKVMELETRVNDLVIAFGGSISVDHNDGLIRTPYLEQMYGSEMITLFARVKELLDPHGIFNPGKKVGGSMEYSQAHIIRRN